MSEGEEAPEGLNKIYVSDDLRDRLEQICVVTGRELAESIEEAILLYHKAVVSEGAVYIHGRAGKIRIPIPFVPDEKNFTDS